ncbi:putative STE kinase [Neospora caninum Liverpool]|uniref:Putative STE kinase n=1 Tax=Neospora caninum (strain Liverpool) TaxID=572307 RepID=F0VLX7_NEOCL|nr:putative STE kinase [Neospora caninum Liverpool]CBZ54255.1 putative STE kinase [Neospora caninum Liverpool]|eukprot:XP_003884286.1 putative STE kinase [Neospora caninum Liverpool]
MACEESPTRRALFPQLIVFDTRSHRYESPGGLPPLAPAPRQDSSRAVRRAYVYPSTCTPRLPPDYFPKDRSSSCVTPERSVESYRALPSRSQPGAQRPARQTHRPRPPLPAAVATSSGSQLSFNPPFPASRDPTALLPPIDRAPHNPVNHEENRHKEALPSDANCQPAGQRVPRLLGRSEADSRGCAARPSLPVTPRGAPVSAEGNADSLCESYRRGPFLPQTAGEQRLPLPRHLRQAAPPSRSAAADSGVPPQEQDENRESRGDEMPRHERSGEGQRASAQEAAFLLALQGGRLHPRSRSAASLAASDPSPSSPETESYVGRVVPAFVPAAEDGFVSDTQRRAPAERQHKDTPLEGYLSTSSRASHSTAPSDSRLFLQSYAEGLTSSPWFTAAATPSSAWSPDAATGGGVLRRDAALGDQGDPAAEARAMSSRFFLPAYSPSSSLSPAWVLPPIPPPSWLPRSGPGDSQAVCAPSEGAARDLTSSASHRKSGLSRQTSQLSASHEDRGCLASTTEFRREGYSGGSAANMRRSGGGHARLDRGQEVNGGDAAAGAAPESGGAGLTCGTLHASPVADGCVRLPAAVPGRESRRVDRQRTKGDTDLERTDSFESIDSIRSAPDGEGPRGAASCTGWSRTEERGQAGGQRRATGGSVVVSDELPPDSKPVSDAVSLPADRPPRPDPHEEKDMSEAQRGARAALVGREAAERFEQSEAGEGRALASAGPHPGGCGRSEHREAAGVSQSELPGTRREARSDAPGEESQGLDLSSDVQTSPGLLPLLSPRSLIDPTSGAGAAPVPPLSREGGRIRAYASSSWASDGDVPSSPRPLQALREVRSEKAPARETPRRQGRGDQLGACLQGPHCVSSSSRRSSLCQSPQVSHAGSGAKGREGRRRAPSLGGEMQGGSPVRGEGKGARRDYDGTPVWAGRPLHLSAVEWGSPTAGEGSVKICGQYRAATPLQRSGAKGEEVDNLIYWSPAQPLLSRNAGWSSGGPPPGVFSPCYPVAFLPVSSSAASSPHLSSSSPWRGLEPSSPPRSLAFLSPRHTHSTPPTPSSLASPAGASLFHKASSADFPALAYARELRSSGVGPASPSLAGEKDTASLPLAAPGSPHSPTAFPARMQVATLGTTDLGRSVVRQWEADRGNPLPQDVHSLCPAPAVSAAAPSEEPARKQDPQALHHAAVIACVNRLVEAFPPGTELHNGYGPLEIPPHWLVAHAPTSRDMRRYAAVCERAGAARASEDASAGSVRVEEKFAEWTRLGGNLGDFERIFDLKLPAVSFAAPSAVYVVEELVGKGAHGAVFKCTRYRKAALQPEEKARSFLGAFAKKADEKASEKAGAKAPDAEEKDGPEEDVEEDEVALKIIDLDGALQLQGSTDKEARVNYLKQVMREVDVLKKCNHEGIVKMYEAFQWPPCYLVFSMELLPGGSLRDLYVSAGPLPEPLIAALLQDVLRALEYLHNGEGEGEKTEGQKTEGEKTEGKDTSEEGSKQEKTENTGDGLSATLGAASASQGHPRRMHRDLKASNILISAEGRAKLIDFGVCADISSSPCTEFVGTPQWMAPELARLGLQDGVAGRRKRPVDAAADSQLGTHASSLGHSRKSQKALTAHGAGDGYDFRVDLWALGITAFEAAVGALPWPRRMRLEDLLLTILEGSPPRINLNEGYEKTFCFFVERCLRKNSVERGTATELLQHPFFKKFCGSSRSRPASHQELREAIEVANGKRKANVLSNLLKFIPFFRKPQPASVHKKGSRSRLHRFKIGRQAVHASQSMDRGKLEAELGVGSATTGGTDAPRLDVFTHRPTADPPLPSRGNQESLFSQAAWPGGASFPSQAWAAASPDPSSPPGSPRSPQRARPGGLDLRAEDAADLRAPRTEAFGFSPFTGVRDPDLSGLGAHVDRETESERGSPPSRCGLPKLVPAELPGGSVPPAAASSGSDSSSASPRAQDALEAEKTREAGDSARSAGAPKSGQLGSLPVGGHALTSGLSPAEPAHAEPAENQSEEEAAPAGEGERGAADHGAVADRREDGREERRSVGPLSAAYLEGRRPQVSDTTASAQPALGGERARTPSTPSSPLLADHSCYGTPKNEIDFPAADPSMLGSGPTSASGTLAPRGEGGSLHAAACQGIAEGNPSARQEPASRAGVEAVEGTGESGESTGAEKPQAGHEKGEAKGARSEDSGAVRGEKHSEEDPTRARGFLASFLSNVGLGIFSGDSGRQPEMSRPEEEPPGKVETTSGYESLRSSSQASLFAVKREDTDLAPDAEDSCLSGPTDPRETEPSPPSWAVSQPSGSGGGEPGAETAGPIPRPSPPSLPVAVPFGGSAAEVQVIACGPSEGGGARVALHPVLLMRRTGSEGDKASVSSFPAPQPCPSRGSQPARSSPPRPSSLLPSPSLSSATGSAAGVPVCPGGTGPLLRRRCRKGRERRASLLERERERGSGGAQRTESDAGNKARPKTSALPQPELKSPSSPSHAKQGGEAGGLLSLFRRAPSGDGRSSEGDRVETEDMQEKEQSPPGAGEEPATSPGEASEAVGLSPRPPDSSATAFLAQFFGSRRRAARGAEPAPGDASVEADAVVTGSSLPTEDGERVEEKSDDGVQWAELLEPHGGDEPVPEGEEDSFLLSSLDGAPSRRFSGEGTANERPAGSRRSAEEDRPDGGVGLEGHGRPLGRGVESGEDGGSAAPLPARDAGDVEAQGSNLGEAEVERERGRQEETADTYGKEGTPARDAASPLAWLWQLGRSVSGAAAPPSQHASSAPTFPASSSLAAPASVASCSVASSFAASSSFSSSAASGEEAPEEPHFGAMLESPTTPGHVPVVSAPGARETFQDCAAYPEGTHAENVGQEDCVSVLEEDLPAESLLQQEASPRSSADGEDAPRRASTGRRQRDEQSETEQDHETRLTLSGEAPADGAEAPRSAGETQKVSAEKKDVPESSSLSSPKRWPSFLYKSLVDGWTGGARSSPVLQNDAPGIGPSRADSSGSSPPHAAVERQEDGDADISYAPVFSRNGDVSAWSESGPAAAFSHSPAPCGPGRATREESESFGAAAVDKSPLSHAAGAAAAGSSVNCMRAPVDHARLQEQRRDVQVWDAAAGGSGPQGHCSAETAAKRGAAANVRKFELPPLPGHVPVPSLALEEHCVRRGVFAQDRATGRETREEGDKAKASRLPPAAPSSRRNSSASQGRGDVLDAKAPRPSHSHQWASAYSSSPFFWTPSVGQGAGGRGPRWGGRPEGVAGVECAGGGEATSHGAGGVVFCSDQPPVLFAPVAFSGLASAPNSDLSTLARQAGSATNAGSSGEDARAGQTLAGREAASAPASPERNSLCANADEARSEAPKRETADAQPRKRDEATGPSPAEGVHCRFQFVPGGRTDGYVSSADLMRMIQESYSRQLDRQSHAQSHGGFQGAAPLQQEHAWNPTQRQCSVGQAISTATLGRQGSQASLATAQQSDACVSTSPCSFAAVAPGARQPLPAGGSFGQKALSPDSSVPSSRAGNAETSRRQSGSGLLDYAKQEESVHISENRASCPAAQRGVSSPERGPPVVRRPSPCTLVAGRTASPGTFPGGLATAGRRHEDLPGVHTPGGPGCGGRSTFAPLGAQIGGLSDISPPSRGTVESGRGEPRCFVPGSDAVSAPVPWTGASGESGKGAQRGQSITAVSARMVQSAMPPVVSRPPPLVYVNSSGVPSSPYPVQAGTVRCLFPATDSSGKQYYQSDRAGGAAFVSASTGHVRRASAAGETLRGGSGEHPRREDGTRHVVASD